jgi:hypothetical protein
MSNYWDMLKSSSIKSIFLAPFYECIRAAPDSLFLGSIILSILTQNLPLIVLSLAMGEIGLIQRFLASILDSVNDNLKSQSPEICRMGIPSPYQISAIGYLIKEYAFPNGTLFFLSAVIVYICSSVMNYQEELNKIDNGQNVVWSSRIPISLTFSTLLLIIFLLYNVLEGCVNVVPALGSIAIGSVIGFCIFLLHLFLFGRTSINLLGIPTLVEDTKTIYAGVST